jgi:adenosine kinase
MVFIGPGNKTDMATFARKAREARVPFFFDPGQSLNIWEGNELREAVEGALCFVSNDYELSLFLQMTDWSVRQLYEKVEAVITTRGPEGAVLDRRGEKILIPAVPVRDVLDPTGAGDAFRAGVLKGLQLGLDWEICCQIGAVCAAFVVEQYGTQEHRMTWEGLCQRYEGFFGSLL